jgi:hypothetical protein
MRWTARRSSATSSPAPRLGLSRRTSPAWPTSSPGYLASSTVSRSTGHGADGQRLLFVLWLLEHGRLDQVTPEFVFVRTNAGRIHKAVKADGERYTNEACNLDDAPGQEVEVTFADLERADPSDLCQQPSCFGEPEGAAA